MREHTNPPASLVRAANAVPEPLVYQPCTICGTTDMHVHDKTVHDAWVRGERPSGYGQLDRGPIFKRPGEERGGRRA